MLVAAARPPQRRESQSVQDHPLAGLRPRRDLDRALAVERGDLDLAAQHRPCGRDSRDADQVLAVALEPLVGRDRDLDVEIAVDGAPGSPAWPAPETRIRWPASIPGGTSTSKVRWLTTRPRPAHSSHGVSGTLPSPPQASQAAVRITWPKAVRATSRSWPVPPHVSQVRMGVPGSAPLPRQCSQVPIASNATSRVAPRDNLGEADLDRGPDVTAGRGPTPAAAEEVAEQRIALAEKARQDVFEAAEAVGSRRPAARPQALVAVARHRWLAARRRRAPRRPRPPA